MTTSQSVPPPAGDRAVASAPAPAPVRSSWCSAGPLRIHAVTTGSPAAAARVVLVHGMVVAARAVQPLAHELWHQGIASTIVELPGFGLSDKPRRALDVDGLADALHSWAAASGALGATFVGNSFGTQVVTAFAQRHPAAPGAVALVAPTIDPRFGRRRWRLLPAGHGRWPAVELARGTALRGVLQRELAASPTLGPVPPLGQLIRREYLAAGLGRALSTYRHAVRDRPEERAAQVRLPVLVVRGGDDRIVGEAWARDLAAAFPAGAFRPLAGAGHDVAFERPAALAAVLAPFVRQVRG